MFTNMLQTIAARHAQFMLVIDRDGGGAQRDGANYLEPSSTTMEV